MALIRYPCPPGFRTLHPCNYTGHEKRRTFRPPRYSINAKPYVNITRISCKVGNSSSQRSITCNPFPSLPASMPLFSLCLLSFFIAKIRSRLHNAEQSHIATWTAMRARATLSNFKLDSHASSLLIRKSKLVFHLQPTVTLRPKQYLSLITFYDVCTLRQIAVANSLPLIMMSYPMNRSLRVAYVQVTRWIRYVDACDETLLNIHPNRSPKPHAPWILLRWDKSLICVCISDVCENMM